MSGVFGFTDTSLVWGREREDDGTVPHLNLVVDGWTVWLDKSG